MKVTVNSTVDSSSSTVTIGDASSLRIEMPGGVIFSINQAEDGNSLNIHESTYRDLVIRPRSANAVTASGESQ